MHTKGNAPWRWPGLEGYIHPLNDDLAYAWLSNEYPTVWHWCMNTQRWVASDCRNHTVVSKDPVHLEPSLLMMCCNMHGYIRDGKWEHA
jgi:hypothetical protein